MCPVVACEAVASFQKPSSESSGMVHMACMFQLSSKFAAASKRMTACEAVLNRCWAPAMVARHQSFKVSHRNIMSRLLSAPEKT